LRTTLSALFAFVCLAACFDPTKAVERSFAVFDRAGGWSRLDTAHFTIWSDAGNAATVAAATELEDTFALMESVVDYVFFVPLRPTLAHWDVLLLNDADGPRRLAGAHVGAFALTVRTDSLYRSMLVMPVGEDLIEVERIRHELAHAFVAAYLPKAPRFLNEGLAEYLATIRRDGDRVLLGRPSRARVFARTHDISVPTGSYIVTFAELPSLATLSAITRDQMTAPGKGPGNYAAAWGLVHMLYGNADLRDALPELYVSIMKQGGKAAWQTFVAEKKDLADRYAKYIATGEKNAFRTEAKVPRPTLTAVPKPLTPAQVGVLGARMIAELDPARHDKLVPEMVAQRGVDEKDPALDAESLYWLGVAHETAKDDSGARRSYEAAIQKDASYARAYVQLLDVVERLGDQATEAALVETLRKLPPTHETLAAIVDHDRSGRVSLATQCIRLSPAYVPCYSAAIRREARDGNIAAARAYVDAAVAILPDSFNAAAFVRAHERMIADATK
jgi:hypothetical protein